MNITEAQALANALNAMSDEEYDIAWTSIRDASFIICECGTVFEESYDSSYCWDCFIDITSGHVAWGRW